MSIRFTAFFSSQKDPELASCFATEKKLLILSGFYLVKPTKYPLLFYLSRIINSGLSVLQLLSSLLLIFLEEVNITVLTGCWLLSVTQVAYLLKLQFFYMKRWDLHNIEQFLIQETSFNRRSDLRTNVINKHFRVCKGMFRLYRTLCALTTIGYGLYPLIDSNKGQLLAIPGYIPWDIVQYNLLTNLLQAFTVGSSAYLNSSLDTLAVSLITIATVQFEILNDNLKTLDYAQHEEMVETELKKRVIHHKKILEYVNQIEKLFTIGLFFQFTASAGVICLTGFQMVVIDFFSIQFLMLTSYFCCMMTQVFLFSWFGQILTIQSHELIRSSYMGNWYESTPKSRKILLISQERYKRPVVITAARFFGLSLATLITILKSSYSYFAVLRSVYVKRIK